MSDPTPIHRSYIAHKAVFGMATPDPEHLRAIDRDGEAQVKGKCPRCGVWGDLDDDMLHGRVSTHHDDPACGYHETKDWWADHVTVKREAGEAGDG